MLLPENKPMHHSRSNTMSVWVMGAAGEGKTTFASTWPNAIMINTDGNFKQFDTPSLFVEEIMVVNGKQLYGADYIEQIVDELIAQKNNEGAFQTIVFDLIEDVVKLYETKVARQNNKEHIQDVPWGKGYKEVSVMIKKLVTKLNSLDMNVVYLSHRVQKNTKDNNGNDLIQFVPKELRDDMIATIAGRVQLMCDLSTYEVDIDGQKTPMKFISWEKSDRFPSIVERFNLLEKYCVATYDSLVALINEKGVE